MFRKACFENSVLKIPFQKASSRKFSKQMIPKSPLGDKIVILKLLRLQLEILKVQEEKEEVQLSLSQPIGLYHCANMKTKI